MKKYKIQGNLGYAQFFFRFGLRFLALGSGWGVNEKVQNAGEPLPNLFQVLTFGLG